MNLLTARHCDPDLSGEAICHLFGKEQADRFYPREDAKKESGM